MIEDSKILLFLLDEPGQIIVILVFPLIHWWSINHLLILFNSSGQNLIVRTHFCHRFYPFIARYQRTIVVNHRRLLIECGKKTRSLLLLLLLSTYSSTQVKMFLNAYFLRAFSSLFLMRFWFVEDIVTFTERSLGSLRSSWLYSSDDKLSCWFMVYLNLFRAGLAPISISDRWHSKNSVFSSRICDDSNSLMNLWST